MRLTSSVTEHSMENYGMKIPTIKVQSPGAGGLYRQGAFYLLALLLLANIIQPAKAEVITIGKGTGIIWEGMPFSHTLSGPMGTAYTSRAYALLSISPFEGGCARSSQMITNIAGYPSVKLAPGVGLVPRVAGTADFVRFGNKPDRMTGTIGLPRTRATLANSSLVILNPTDFEWCLPPSPFDDHEFYEPDAPRSATITGSWVMVADGSQVSGEHTIRQMYFGSFSADGSGDLKMPILPTSITLRISTLECSVSTPTMINFGSVERLTQAGAELAVASRMMNTTCSQASDHINANINLQFRALTSLYEGQPTRLALAEGGGYITGEINNGATGSGACNNTTGLPFDNTQVKIGDIQVGQYTKTIENQVTWRLCSGGASLPIGPVTASAEMLVTFN